MKGPGIRTFVLAIGIIVVMLSAGCEEEQLKGNQKARVIAAENMQMKNLLQQRDSEIEKLKEQHKSELKKQEELLAKCKDEKQALEEQLTEKYGDQIDEFIGNLGAEYVKLHQENDGLKLQIEKLKAELEEIKKPTEQPVKPL